MPERQSPVAPFLPLATEYYDPRNIEQITRALRLYFNQLDLSNQLTLVELSSAILSAGNAEQKAVEALTATAQLRDDIRKQLQYGAFFDTTDQYAAVANTAYAMTFDSTDMSDGVSIGSPTSRVYVTRASVFNIQFSAQLLSNSGGTHLVWIWLRKNGVNVPHSTTLLTVEGNNTAVVAAWNFLLSMNDGDYFELMWESNDTYVFLHADAATAVHPAIPSVILTVTDNFSDSFI